MATGFPIIFSPRLWTPAVITTDLWFDAADAGTITLNGTTVSQWNDKSGKGRNATQATAADQPVYLQNTLNGNPILRFTTSDRMDTAYQWPSTQTVALVIASNASTITANTISTAYGNTNPPSFPNMTAIETHNGFASTASPRITFELQSSATNVINRINGTNLGLLDTVQYQFVTAVLQADNMTQTGRNVNFGSIYANPSTSFDIAECVTIASYVSGSIVEKLEGYLAWKWGMVKDLPSSHPYKNSPPYAS